MRYELVVIAVVVQAACDDGHLDAVLRYAKGEIRQHLTGCRMVGMEKTIDEDRAQSMLRVLGSFEFCVG